MLPEPWATKHLKSINMQTNGLVWKKGYKKKDAKKNIIDVEHCAKEKFNCTVLIDM